MDDRRMNFHSSILQVASIIKNKDQIKAATEKKKRDRKANYSTEETNKLVDLVLMKKDILECKKNNSDLWNEKREAWDDIEREFNKNLNSGEVYRNSKTLRIKYESLKRDIKRKWNHYLTRRKKSSGKMPKFTTAEKKIKDIISLPMEGFCDFDAIDVDNYNKSDSDEFSNVSSKSDSDVEDSTSLKKEELNSDEGITKKACPIGFDDSPVIRQDPFVGINNDQKNTADIVEPTNKRIRKTLFVDDQDKVVDGNDIDAEKMKTKLHIEMLKEELEIKKLHRKMLEQEIEQKRIIHELEKEQLVLKIKALKNESS